MINDILNTTEILIHTILERRTKKKLLLYTVLTIKKIKREGGEKEKIKIV